MIRTATFRRRGLILLAFATEFGEDLGELMFAKILRGFSGGVTICRLPARPGNVFGCGASLLAAFNYVMYSYI